MDFRAGLILAVSFILSSCSTTIPAKGLDRGTGQAYTGEVIMHMNGSGKVLVRAPGGAACSGEFVYVLRHEAEGTLTCDDGRTGPFRIVSDGPSGTGHGTLAGEPFTFTFGDTPGDPVEHEGSMQIDAPPADEAAQSRSTAPYGGAGKRAAYIK